MTCTMSFDILIYMVFSGKLGMHRESQYIGLGIFPPYIYRSQFNNLTFIPFLLSVCHSIIPRLIISHSKCPCNKKR
ncbi:hypothetical protein ACN38_g894 [Penicillium nordicum]|uniref:Uncharacterized protein n=1 Tax=Penicillium nordicum TaxID=229535 RepID=A0A0M8PCG7_9EURO|nr:hypothetical protein ACN38_g894 [Penicillium nordicum]